MHTTLVLSVPQTLLKMDRLTVEETRDLLISVLFILKHVDSSVLLHLWRECITCRAPVFQYLL